jgi:hypothetical protein
LIACARGRAQGRLPNRQSGKGLDKTTAVKQTGNTANITAHAITPTAARYVKLNITAPSVNGDSRARIYEFEAFK